MYVWGPPAATSSVLMSISTAAETLSGAVTLKLTGEATDNNDISQELMVVRKV